MTRCDTIDFKMEIIDKTEHQHYKFYFHSQSYRKSFEIHQRKHKQNYHYHTEFYFFSAWVMELFWLNPISR